MLLGLRFLLMLPMGHIYWGGAAGYHQEKRTDIRLETRLSLSVAIADLNKDGFLDLVFSDVDSENLDIFWGGPGNYGPEKRTLLKVQPSATVEIADLNGDGWLDVILGWQLLGDPLLKISP